MKYSELYGEKSTIKLGTEETISLTDTFPNLFKVNEPIDNSIVYTTCKDNTLWNASIDIDTGANNNVTFVYDTIALNNGKYINKIKYAPIYQNEQFKPQYTLVNKSITFWNGVNFDKTEVIGKNSQSKFVRNMKTNNMLFRVSIKGCYKTDITENYNNKPNIIDISLLDLINNPELYYVTNISMPNPYIFYMENGVYKKTTQDIKICFLNSTDTSTGIAEIVNCIRIDPFNSSTPRETSFLSNNSGQKGSFLGGSNNEILYNMIKYYSVDTIPEFEMDFPNFDITEITEKVTINYGIKKIAECANSIFCQDTTIGFNYNSNTNTPYVTNTSIKLYRILKGEFVVKLLAGSGLYFIPADTILPDDLTPDNLGNYDFVCLGEMDADGYTTGRFIVGNDINTYTGYNKNGSTQNETFNPDKNVFTDDDDIESVGYGYFSNTVMGTLYSLYNKLDLEKISQWFYNQTEKIDIANNVISLKEIPFSLTALNIVPLDTDLKIGGVNVTYNNENIKVGQIVSSATTSLSVLFGEFNIPRLSSTFLDYSPYTKYELLLPFAPTPVTLPDWCVNKTVQAIFLYDIYTTSCQYVIECNGERICSVSGCFGIDRPISAQNVALKDASRLSAQVATASSVLGGVMSSASGNIGGIVSGAVSGVSALSQQIMSQKQNYMYTVGANGDSSSVGLCHAVHLKITRTLSADDSNFTHVYGRPLCKYKKLSSVTGYTKCDNINTTGLTCSEIEKQRIKQLLETGIYI